MSGAKHTPGPWVFHRRAQRIYGSKIGGEKIAQIGINPDWEANARLIAAAPDLLEALAIQNEWVRAALECKDWHWDGDQRVAAEQSLAAGLAAIAKAEAR